MKVDDIKVERGGDHHPQNISWHSRTDIKWSERGKGGNEHMTILRYENDGNPWNLYCQCDLCQKEILPFPILIPSFPNPPTYSPNPPTFTYSLSLTLPPSLLCSPRALETEWSECEPTIVEINGIWSTAYKEWQSLDSKWAKRVVRTWAVLVVRKGWREREMEWWREGRRPLAVCSRTKCWIMRSDWHDPAPELRETALPLHLSRPLFLDLILFVLLYTYFPFLLSNSLSLTQTTTASEETRDVKQTKLKYNTTIRGDPFLYILINA